jgi:RNA polymerase sigma factor (sigma-70 family)
MTIGRPEVFPLARQRTLLIEMQTFDDMQLLQEYASGRSEEAFATLVSRYINLVYSAALRSVNNPSQAEEITQSVFVTLARKSDGLRRGTILSGWLYQTARLTASNFIRTEVRRQQREQRAHIESTMNEPEAEPWTQIGPLLEEAMAQLNEKDRNAIVLRFFEGKPLKEVGLALSASEDAAKIRVARALDKLREFFKRRGITVPAGVLAAVIAEKSIQAAPAGLAVTVTANALHGLTATVSTLTLVKGAIHMMTSAKISAAIGLGAAAIIVLQAHQVSVQKQTVKALQEQVAKTAPQAQSDQKLRAEIAKLEAENAAYAKTIDNMQHAVAKARAHATDALAATTAAKAAAANAKSNPLANMFSDPETLKAMRPTQIATTKMMYGPLVKRLNLSDDQADKLYNTIVDSGLKSLAMMQSGSAADMKSSSQSLEADVHVLLGDADFAAFQSYVKNDMADQSMLNAMKNDFADTPLSDAQQQQLLQAMESARKSVSASNPLASPPVNPSDPTAAMDSAMQRQMEQQAQINEQVLQQAAAFLSPEQLHTLGTSQSNMIAMQKSMAPMMQKMFSKATPAP